MTLSKNVIQEIMQAIGSIPNNSDFVASQASTCKIEHVLRDYIYFYFRTHQFLKCKKEVPIKIPHMKKSPSSDLVLYDKDKDSEIALVELKQFYTDDITYSKRLQDTVFQALKKDSEKYQYLPNAIPVLNILFLVHFDCSPDIFKKHGTEFKYYSSFLGQRTKDSAENILKETINILNEEPFHSKKQAEVQIQRLGTSNSINISLLSFIYSF